MKNKAFTMAEALIALALVAVLAALSVVAISNSKPDESIVKFRKGYATTVRVVNELLNDEELYPNAKEPYDSTTSTLGDSGDIKGLADLTVTDEMRTKYPCLNDAGDYGVMKFPNLFAYKVNAIDSTRPADNAKTFTTPDGINWQVNGYTGANINGNGAALVIIDTTGSNESACWYSATTCKVPTLFRFRIRPNGIIEILNDPMACSYLRYPKINKAKKIPTINNSCFDNGGGGSSSGSSGGSSGSTSSSGSGSTSSGGSGSTTSSGSGSTTSSGSGSTTSSGSGSTTSSGSGSTSSSGSGSTSSSGSGSTSSGGSGGGTAAAAAGGSGGAYQGSPLLISIDTFLENSYLDKTGTKVLTSFYEKHPEFKAFNLVEPMKLFNDRVITYFIALHQEMKDNKDLTIGTNEFITSPKYADFKALAEIYFPAFVFAYHKHEFRTEEIDGYSYKKEWVQKNITNSLIETMRQVQATGDISEIPSEGELSKLLFDRLLEGQW